MRSTLRRAISPSRCVCSSIFSSSVSVRVRKRASAGQARWTLRPAKSNSRFRRQDTPDTTEKGRYLGVDDRVHVCFQRHPVDELANSQVENRGVKTPHHLNFQNVDWKLRDRRTAVFSSDL